MPAPASRGCAGCSPNIGAVAALKVGVSLQPHHATLDELRAAWREADSMGVDSIWTWDHFYPLGGNPNGNSYEGVTLLAAMACDTQHATVGLMVACATYRNPDVYAHAVATADRLSGGRAVLGIGAGWFERDFTEYGFEFGTAGSRLKRLEHDVERIKARLAKLHPGPAGTLPICIGGGGEQVTLRIVAQHADIWNGFGPAANYRRKMRVLDEWCERVGRDPKAIERSANMRAPSVEDARAMFDAGCRHLVVSTAPPYDLEPAKRVLELARGGTIPA